MVGVNSVGLGLLALSLVIANAMPTDAGTKKRRLSKYSFLLCTDVYSCLRGQPSLCI